MQTMAFSLCGILEFHPVLRQKQHLTAFTHAQESRSGASCFPAGTPFTVNCTTYSHCRDGGLSKPNLTGPEGGCEHRKVRNPSATNPKSKLLFKLTMIPHKIYFWYKEDMFL